MILEHTKLPLQRPQKILLIRNGLSDGVARFSISQQGVAAEILQGICDRLINPRSTSIINRHRGLFGTPARAAAVAKIV